MKKVFIVCGSPGAGKSVYAAELAMKEQAALVDIDTCTELIVKSSLVSLGHNPDDRDSQFFKTNFREPIYETLFRIAAENLRCLNVVLVGPFTAELRDPIWLDKLSTILQAEVEAHYIFCELSERKRRLELRNNPRDRQKLKDWDKHIEYYAGEKPPEFAHKFIQTS